MGNKLLDAVPLLADQPRHRGGGSRHLEAGAEGMGEGIEVARQEGLEPLVQLEGAGGIQEGISAGGFVLVDCGGWSLGADLPPGTCPAPEGVL
jgi:hypothetical protein